MKIYQGFGDKRLQKKNRSVAIGIFDGVHLGHQKILKKLIADARRNHRPAMLITFDPHPVKVLRPGTHHPQLMSLAHRLRVIEKLGVDEAVIVHFDKKFAHIAHENFLTDFLIGRCGARCIVVGHDFRFGSGGAGNNDYLERNAGRLGYKLFAVPALTAGGRVISSTRLRLLILSGKLKEASRILGRPVSVYGDVVKGKGRGKALGFPTANINPHHETLPPSAVYAAHGYLGKRRLAGVLHIGARPTFGERDKSVEVHFFNLHENLYGKEIELEFVSKLRPIKHFESKEALIRAISTDIRRARRLVF